MEDRNSLGAAVTKTLRVGLSLVLTFAALALHSQDASANEPRTPGDAVGNVDGLTTVSFAEDVEIPGDSSGDTFAATVAAERPHPEVTPSKPPCFKREAYYIDDQYRLRIWLPGQGPCLEELVCGAERVDDFFNGRLATPEASSAELARYLTSFFTDALPTNFDIDATAHATSLVGVALGEQPEETSLPVFNWCRGENGTEYTTTGNYRTNFTCRQPSTTSTTSPPSRTACSLASKPNSLSQTRRSPALPTRPLATRG